MVEEAPQDWPGTLPEYLVFMVLTKLKIDFDYQSRQMGGRMERGGAVLDFHIPSLNMGINVNSVYWHYARPDQIENDLLQREALEAQGLQVIYVDEEDLLRNAFWYVQEALRGNDHSRVTQ